MTALAVAAAFALLAEPPVPTMLVFPPFGHCMGIYRAGTEQLSVLLGGLVRFDDPQGLACVKLEAWDDPATTEDDDELAVYGVNSGSGHVIYNADMYSLGLYGGSGSGPDELDDPHGIAVTASGTVLVADTGNGRVVILERRGSRLVPAGFLGGELSEPWDVAITGAGGVAVTDRAAGALLLYESPDDTLPRTVPLDSPTGVDAVEDEPWFHPSRAFAAVVTGDGTSLTIVEGDSVAASVSVRDIGGADLCYPAIDYYGNVWVTDSTRCCVHKLRGDLTPLGSFGSPGTGDRELDRPTGLAIWRRYGQVFIAEREGARYFWIGADILEPELSVSGRGITLTGLLTEEAYLDVRVDTPSGGSSVVLHSGRADAGPLTLSWDGTDVRGIHLEGGDGFELVAEVRPTYSSRNYFEKTFRETFSLDDPPAGDGPTGGRGRG